MNQMGQMNMGGGVPMQHMGAMAMGGPMGGMPQQQMPQQMGGMPQQQMQMGGMPNGMGQQPPGGGIMF